MNTLSGKSSAMEKSSRSRPLMPTISFMLSYRHRSSSPPCTRDPRRWHSTIWDLVPICQKYSCHGALVQASRNHNLLSWSIRAYIFQFLQSSFFVSFQQGSFLSDQIGATGFLVSFDTLLMLRRDCREDMITYLFQCLAFCRRESAQIDLMQLLWSLFLTSNCLGPLFYCNNGEV